MVACARLGAKTFLVGRVGGDVFGERLIDAFGTAGVDHSNVAVDTNITSGGAVAYVFDLGNISSLALTVNSISE